MSNQKYLDLFRAKVEMIQQLGGKPGSNTNQLRAQLVEEGHDPDTATIDQETMTK